MAADASDPESLISALPLWSGPIEIEPLAGGITNKNYLVSEKGRRVVVRYGGDIPAHGVMRFNELAAAKAAAAAEISPKVLYAAPPFLAMDFIEGQTYGPEDVRKNLRRCVALAKRVHHELRAHLRGPTLCFNVFHVIHDYAQTLVEEKSRKIPLLPRLLERAQRLEHALGPIDLVFGHNDLLAANFIDDGARLWLIDWDYAGWGTPFFDLGGLSSNNGFTAEENEAMLAAYFERTPSDELSRRLRAMVCASLLRESLWSMVSEIKSMIDFDYVAYTEENLRRFEAAFAAFEEFERA
ncbi:choline kinase family protein [Methylocystis bryophila]|uniref:Choline kinase n=1 Tax=Methylocystis bryophila TaxID=655015 RepID=A0A1W6MVB5_9HYPH|nr:choline kinase family protein [Methylocystis bryophila]ARN81540.1 choline kinase [Methylocystis bryophila]BDV37567.1 choline kinase [Methylocystis bryophila]